MLFLPLDRAGSLRPQTPERDHTIACWQLLPNDSADPGSSELADPFYDFIPAFVPTGGRKYRFANLLVPEQEDSSIERADGAIATKWEDGVQAGQKRVINCPFHCL